MQIPQPPPSRKTKTQKRKEQRARHAAALSSVWPPVHTARPGAVYTRAHVVADFREVDAEKRLIAQAHRRTVDPSWQWHPGDKPPVTLVKGTVRNG